MDYFLVHNDQNNAYLTIGTDNGFGVFWADQGFEALTNLISKSPSYLEDIEIKNSQNKTESIPDFLEKVSKLKLRVAN